VNTADARVDSLALAQAMQGESGTREPVQGSPHQDPAAIRARNIGKSYQVYETPRDRLKQFLMPRLQNLLGMRQRRYFREFTALRGISFEVGKGETVGIIGRNGAGKSTLLQIICGTLTPTSGSVSFNGRVAALLELGSGFNAEFTGRENVRMNAGVLGLSAEQIDARFDDIIAFADIGDFLDQPVKAYSSGMYVRLAFAVIVHVDADILIVDEALSVGDMYFQAKCIAHMKKLMASGVTVLFVSHDVGAVKALCNRAIYLDRGVVVAVGPTAEVVDLYYGMTVKSTDVPAGALETTAPHEMDWLQIDIGQRQAFATRAAFQRVQNGVAEFIDVYLTDLKGSRIESVDFGQTVILRMLFSVNVPLGQIGLGYHIRDRNGVDVVYSDTGIEGCHIENAIAGEVIKFEWQFSVNLRQGNYSISAILSVPEDLSIGKVDVCDFIPLAGNFIVSRGTHLPIYGAVYWKNLVTHQRSSVLR
jgi:lipopolysaccharide transport system ATP-binding protein